MVDRVAQFREIQEGLNEICYNDNFLQVINNVLTIQEKLPRMERTTLNKRLCMR